MERLRSDAFLAVFSPRGRITAACVIAAAVFYLTARCTFYTIFTGFRPYDDEGTMLSVLAELVRGHVLYDQVVAMYGPIGFFPKVAIVKLLHLTVSHNLSRTMTWQLYCAGCLTAGAATWRLTRQISSFVLASSTTYFLLRWLGGESGHPQDECQLLLALSVLVATFTEGRHARKAYLALAVIGGLLAMTKGNLGLFFLAAYGSSLVMLLNKSWIRLPLRVATFIALILLPFIFLNVHIDVTSVYRFFVSIECALISCFLISLRRTNDGSVSVSSFLLYIGCFAATVIVVFLGTLLTGTTLKGMTEGLIYLPLRGSNQFFFLWRQTDWMIPMGAAGMMASLVSMYYLRSRYSQDNTIPTFVALMRLGGGMLVAKVALYDAAVGQEFLMEIVPPFIWLLLLPTNRPGESVNCTFPRVFIAFLAITETLQSYPNAGTQQAIGLVIPVCISIVCLYDGVIWFVRTLRYEILTFIQNGFNVVLTLTVLCYCGIHLLDRAAAYRSLVPLNLPGSNMIHVSSIELDRYRSEVNTLEANADLFMTLPGMNSFYFWTRMRPPTLANVTSWMTLTEKQQSLNYKALQAANHPCVLFDQKIAAFWTHGLPNAAEAPIIQLVKENYRVAISEPTWTLLIPRYRNEATLVSAGGEWTHIVLPPISSAEPAVH